MNDLSPQTIKSLVKNQDARRALTKDSHKIFFSVYFPSYITHGFAPFHHEMFQLSEDEKVRMLVVMSFRGSGKSTILNTSLAIWSILGKQQKKFVLILSETQEQARTHLKNLKTVLEENELLRADLGPFQEIEEPWNATTLIIPKYGARITVASSEQSVRGMRNNEHRPDLIIADDIESTPSVKTRDGRNKIDDWFTSEILPIGDIGTRIVVVGNQLHRDSLLMRLKARITEGEMSGVYKQYPLLDENGDCLWPQKFKTEKDIEDLRKTIGREEVFLREYLLQLVDKKDQVIKKEWIAFYETLPEIHGDKEEPEFYLGRQIKVLTWPKKPEKEPFEYRGTIVGIDPAISLSDAADSTAMVACHVFGYGENLRIFILPLVINEKLTLQNIIAKAKRYKEMFPRETVRFVVEDVAAQNYLIQLMKAEGLFVSAMKVSGLSKHDRLVNSTLHFEKGRVLFPKKGAEQLIEQVLDFGTEKHDDLADALTSMIAEISRVYPYSRGDDGHTLSLGKGETIVGNIWIKQF